MAAANKENAIEIVDFIMSWEKRTSMVLFLWCFVVGLNGENWNLTPVSVVSSKSTLMSNGMVIIQNLFSLCEGPNQWRERERLPKTKIKPFPQQHTLTHNYKKKIMTLNFRDRYLPSLCLLVLFRNHLNSMFKWECECEWVYNGSHFGLAAWKCSISDVNFNCDVYNLKSIQTVTFGSCCDSIALFAVVHCITQRTFDTHLMVISFHFDGATALKSEWKCRMLKFKCQILNSSKEMKWDAKLDRGITKRTTNHPHGISVK